jgi:endonuclease/exonuclease/phosphatase family metal-dependent hydrolase
MADQTREAFTSIVDSLASRRRILGGLVGGTVAGLLGWQESDADRKRRKTGRNGRRNQRDNNPRVNAQGKSNDSPATLKVMTRNIYFGTDLAPVFAVESFEELLDAVADIFALVEATNFPERAKVLAKEIATFNPHLVGLQEVAQWRSQFPADSVSHPDDQPNANTVEYDFLAILLEELAQRGKSYEAVAIVENTDAEAPRLGPTGLEDIRFTDRDVILARTDLPASRFEVTDTQSDNFDATFTLDSDVLGLIPIPRGWTAVDATLDGRAVRVVSTHLEPLHPGIHVAQGNELLAGPLNTELPVVLLGDLNSAADSIGPVPPRWDTPTYANLLAAGFIDAAAGKKGKKQDLTCCQDADVANESSNLSVRIDFVLSRGGFESSAVKVVGNKQGDKTPSGLWPSDHAGVTAILHLKK